MSLSDEKRIEFLNNLKGEKPIVYFRDYFSFLDAKSILTNYNFTIKDILDEFYSEYRNEKGRLINVPGDDNEYSMLNYLTGNFSCIHIFVNYINNKIIKEANENDNLIATRQLNFNEDKSNWIDEFDNLTTLMTKYRHEILKLNENGVFISIIQQLEKSKKIGVISEKEMTVFIKSFIPLAKNFKFGGDGDENDIFKGIDIQFDLGHKTFTLQQKSCTSVNKFKNSYYVHGVGSIKEYYVDYLGFKTGDNELFMFKGNGVKIKENKYNKKMYQIPNKNFVASKKLKIKKVEKDG